MLFVLLALVLLCAAVAGFALWRSLGLQREVDELRAGLQSHEASFDELEEEVLARAEALEAEQGRLRRCVETLEQAPLEEDYEEEEPGAQPEAGGADLQTLLANVATALTTLRPPTGPPPRVEEVDEEEAEAEA